MCFLYLTEYSVKRFCRFSNLLFGLSRIFCLFSEVKAFLVVSKSDDSDGGAVLENVERSPRGESIVESEDDEFSLVF